MSQGICSFVRIWIIFFCKHFIALTLLQKSWSPLRSCRTYFHIFNVSPSRRATGSCGSAVWTAEDALPGLCSAPATSTAGWPETGEPSAVSYTCCLSAARAWRITECPAACYNSIRIPRKQWGLGRRWLTLLSSGHGSNPARWPMSARVWRNTGASIIVTVRCHGKGQGLEVSADLLCQVGAQVGSVAVGLPFSIGKWAGAKVSSCLGVLERRPKKRLERT